MNPFPGFLGKYAVYHTIGINRLAENTLELKIIDSNSNYERACVELYRVAVLHSEHISMF